MSLFQKSLDAMEVQTVNRASASPDDAIKDMEKHKTLTDDRKIPHKEFDSKISIVDRRNCKTYACENCGFLFCRTGEITECPSCGKDHIRFATGEEIIRLRMLLEKEKAALQVKEKQSL